MNSIYHQIPLSRLLTPIDRREEPVLGTEYRQVGVRLWGEGAYERDVIDGSETRYKTLSRVEVNDIIVNKIWARNGSVSVIMEDTAGGYVSSEFPLFVPDINQLSPKWFFYLTKTPYFWQQCSEKSHGTSGKNRIKPAKFLEIKIPLPKLSEQNELVAHIEAIAQRIEEARGLRREAMLDADALFEAEINKVFEACQTHDSYPLKDLTTKIGSGSTPRGGKAVYLENGIPFIRSLNVRMRRFQYDDLAFIPNFIHERMRGTQLQSGDVLLNITGASIGRVACFPDDIDEGNVNQHVGIIRPRPERISSRFLMYWLSQPKLQQYINEKQKGGTRQGFTKAQIQAMEIPVISLDEQFKIVADLDALHSHTAKLKHLQEETQNDLNALLPAVLDRVFREK